MSDWVTLHYVTHSGSDLSLETHHVTANDISPTPDVTDDGSGRSGVADTLAAKVFLEHESLALTHTLASVPSNSVVIDSSVSGDAESRLLFLSVVVDDIHGFEASLAVDDSVAEFTSLGTFASQQVYRIRLAATTSSVLSATAELGIRVVEMRNDGNGWLLRLQFRGRSPLLALREHCSEHDIYFRLRALTADVDDTQSVTSLTAAQRETLLTAYEMGYYDLPRGSSQEELAEATGVSASAISQRLRRAVGALIEDVLVSDVQG